MNSSQPKISPRNLAAQLDYRGRGNPPVTHPRTAISNCFPGLEFDFRAIWRRIFIGLVMTECSNFVADVEDPKLADLKGHRLLRIDGNPVAVVTKGTNIPGRAPTVLSTGASPDAVSFMEWGNSIALLVGRQGETVSC